MTEHQYTMTAVKDCVCHRCTEYRTRAEMEDPRKAVVDELWDAMTTAKPSRFDELLAQMKQVHDKKGQDYEAHDIPYENIKASEQWSVEPWTYAMLRVSEKMRRLQSAAKGKTLQNETVYDAFIDIANLSLIAFILYEKRQK